ncbi:hypothetical protein IWX83_003224 [Flavobacterium sp. CG_9.1]|nr:hypothetical protein [Flavobacterium sp. CG_9.1]MBG6063414.1 hypothetical protein [Flavobacterium sp. CG_9.1]
MIIENLELEILSEKETLEIDGGWYILRITGLFDGVKGNTEFDWFNFS